MKKLSKFFVLAAVLAVVVRTAPAQFETATVLGTVKDATGSVVVGSKVTLENTRTGVISLTRFNAWKPSATRRA